MTQFRAALGIQSPASAPHERWNWSRGGRTAWLVSFTLHAAALIAICAWTQRKPKGVAIEPTREGGIVLVARSGHKAEYSGDRAGADTTPSLDPETPPALLPAATDPPAVETPHLPFSDVVQASGMFVDLAFPTPAAPAVSHPAMPGTRGGRNSTETQVFGVKGAGSRFVYVFDRSSSMEGGPLHAAKRELIASLQCLQGVHQFQIIFYNQEPQLMPEFRGGGPRMVSADESGKRLAASFVGSVSAFGSTDHVKALHQALQLRPDVIFFLTDADEPQLTSADFRCIRQWNQGTLINAIEFGVGPPKTRFNFLMNLADENGGRHTYVDVTRLVK